MILDARLKPRAELFYLPYRPEEVVAVDVNPRTDEWRAAVVGPSLIVASKEGMRELGTCVVGVLHVRPVDVEVLRSVARKDDLLDHGKIRWAVV